MSVLIGIALKSLLIAGLTLGLLRLMHRRSAAERSWIAHVGLFALIVMALAPLVLPSWTIETPHWLGATAELPQAVDPAPVAPIAATPAPALPVTRPVATAKTAALLPSMSPVAATTAIYAVPAAILLLITFLALARLVALQARADVLVDAHWLSALARAQRRMGFKHGTALLTSDELASPISWGVIRPVILLNSRAVEAAEEAEAIIAHELAHVARLDWLKLLLARVATALFWFNPLAWLLAREAHQLREETADDTVLSANIVDTDYAQLLVGVARHECPGLLLGAHGVAPSKSSLARRVARVLDGKSVRGPVARSFALGVFAGAVLVAAPLAAVTLAPAAPRAPKAATGTLAASDPRPAYYPARPQEPTDLPSIIARGVSTSVTTAVAAASAVAPQVIKERTSDFRLVASSGASVEGVNGTVVSRAPSGATVTVYPADAHGQKKIVARAANGATSVTYVDADDGRTYVVEKRRPREVSIDDVIQMRAVGVTPEYMAAMRAASPRLRSAGLDDIVSMRAVGVTPEYVRSMANAGLSNLDAEELTQARAVGVDPEYIRAMVAAGFRGNLDDYIQMRAVGVTPEYAAQFRKSGYTVLGARQLIKMKVHGVTADALRAEPPAPPRTPAPPRDPDEDADPGG